MSVESDSDSAPEELTFEQGNKLEEELRVVQKENKARVAQEKKEKKRLWEERRKQRESARAATLSSKQHEDPTSCSEKDEEPDAAIPVEEPDAAIPVEEPDAAITGMLPSNIVSFLTTREKQVFNSDSEEETVEDETASFRKKKKQKPIRTNTMLLKDLPQPVCAKNSLEFLKRRKAQVPRSQAVLRNAGETFRLLSSRGNLLSKSSPGLLKKG